MFPRRSAWCNWMRSTKAAHCGYVQRLFNCFVFSEFVAVKVTLLGPIFSRVGTELFPFWERRLAPAPTRTINLTDSHPVLCIKCLTIRWTSTSKSLLLYKSLNKCVIDDEHITVEVQFAPNLAVVNDIIVGATIDNAQTWHYCNARFSRQRSRHQWSKPHLSIKNSERLIPLQILRSTKQFPQPTGQAQNSTLNLQKKQLPSQC